ncbi:hypothetical protein SLS58_005825 [Diplodia intermedia]|uniref:Uncharacterized protein n=1 Tax=Diplodia intermedia TaxID=856260 RepID=A0ABR3TPJ9_9PEZI
MSKFTEEEEAMLRLLAIERQEVEIRLGAIRRQKRKATDDIAPARDISGPSVAREPDSSMPQVIDLGNSDAETSPCAAPQARRPLHEFVTPAAAPPPPNQTLLHQARPPASHHERHRFGPQAVRPEPQTVNAACIIDLGSEDDDDDDDDNDASDANSVPQTMTVVGNIRRNPTRVQPQNRQPLIITKGGDLPRSLDFSQPFADVPSPGMHTYACIPEHWRALRATHPKFGCAQWGLEMAGKVTWPADTFLAGEFRKVDVCLPGKVTAYDDPNFIQSCREIVWDLYTIYADGLTPWDPLKGETIYSTNPQLRDKDGCVFDSCPYNRTARRLYGRWATNATYATALKK